MSKQRIEDRIGRVYAAGGDPSTLAAEYDAWAEGYESDLASLGYRYPIAVAGMAGRHLPADAEPILDAGAGTGLIGEALALLGYRRLVALDLSAGMLRVAAAKGVYEATRVGVLGERLDLPDGGFGAMVCAGTLTSGHAPPDCLDDLLRVVRRGGLLLFTISGDGLAAGFGDKLAALAAAGRWTRVAATGPFRAMPGGAAEAMVMGQVFVYRRT